MEIQVYMYVHVSLFSSFMSLAIVQYLVPFEVQPWDLRGHLSILSETSLCMASFFWLCSNYCEQHCVVHVVGHWLPTWLRALKQLCKLRCIHRTPLEWAPVIRGWVHPRRCSWPPWWTAAGVPQRLNSDTWEYTHELLIRSGNITY